MISEPFLGDALELLQGPQTLEERWANLLAIFGRIGADQVNYAVLDLGSAERESAGVIQFSNMDATWIDHYLTTRLDLHDPHVRFVRQCGLRPYRFHEKLADQLEDAAEAAVIRQAAEAGLRSQLSVIAPDRFRNGEPIGGMSIGSSLDASEFFGAVRGQELALLSVAMLFHEQSLGDIRREQSGCERLSARERDCLTLLALGERVMRIAERLGITEATVELHLRNCRRKLRAQTSAQAVARAILFGDVVI